jgi:hypothetical protein
MADNELLRSNPDLANTLKAYEVGHAMAKRAKTSLPTMKREDTKHLGPIQRPAKGDAKRKRRLVDLSDEE